MADWTTLPNLAVGVGGLPSGTTVTALRDNPIAIAEGAPGAPRVDARAKPFSEYLPYARESGTSIFGYFNLDPLATTVFFFSISASNNNMRTGLYRVSDDNGATWSSWINLGSSVDGVSQYPMVINNKTGFVSISGGVESNTGISNINAIEFKSDNSTSFFYQTGFGFQMTRAEAG